MLAHRRSELLKLRFKVDQPVRVRAVGPPQTDGHKA